MLVRTRTFPVGSTFTGSVAELMRGVACLTGVEEVRCLLMEPVFGAVSRTAVKVSGTAWTAAGTGETDDVSSDGTEDIRGVFVPLILLFRG